MLYCNCKQYLKQKKRKCEHSTLVEDCFVTEEHISLVSLSFTQTPAWWSVSCYINITNAATAVSVLAQDLCPENGGCETA